MRVASACGCGGRDRGRETQPGKGQRSVCVGGAGSDEVERKWQLTLVFLPGKFHGQAGVLQATIHGFSESDMTK